MEIDNRIINLAAMVKAILVQRKETLSCCESLTGGLFGASICCIPGASDCFKGGVITYCDAVKVAVGVSQKTLDDHTAISGECAQEMALAASRFTQSDWAVSFTGNAGPTAQDGAPVGLVFIGVAHRGQVRAFRYQLEGDRSQVRLDAVLEGLRLLLKAIADE